MKNISRVLFIVLLLAAPTLLAEPPARIIRLNLTEGDVSFRPAGIDEWTEATVNRPLIDGDELWTDAFARAEMHIGSSVVRLGNSSSFGVISQTDRDAQLSLTAGIMNVRLREVGEDDVWEIDTPNASVSLLRPGRYRIEVSSDGETTIVTTRGGEAEVSAGRSAFPLHAREQAEIRGGDERPDITEAPSLDDFDEWCRGRDEREDRIASIHYVPRDLVGYEDLDSYGTWRLAGSYGWVWTPNRIVAGWAPYRYGHWAWVEPWGWTWIDDAPWGFAPFHYGRWAYYESGWVWVPGRIVHPVYAPALVAFGGGGFVAWWPLAPGEVYVPAYRVQPRYVREINVGVVDVGHYDFNRVNPREIRYRNQTVGGAVTAVTQEAFVSSKRVAPVNVSRAEIVSLAPVGTAPAVAPKPASVLGTAVTARTAVRPPSATIGRSVVARTPPPPPPVPFSAKQRELIVNPGKPLDTTATEKIRVESGTPPPRVRTVTPSETIPLKPATSSTTTSAPAYVPPPQPQHVRPAFTPKPAVQPRTPAPVTTTSAPAAVTTTSKAAVTTTSKGETVTMKPATNAPPKEKKPEKKPEKTKEEKKEKHD